MTQQAFDISTPITAPAWLPASFLDDLTPGEATTGAVDFGRAERRVFRQPEKVTVSQWAANHRIVTMSVLPGPWRNETTPWLAGIMDGIGFSSVRRGILCKTPQTGGSEAGLNILGHHIDQQGGPAMILFPDELTGKEYVRDRISPMVNNSPRLAKYLTGKNIDDSATRINLNHMAIYLAWASSASRLANKPVQLLIRDEVDKYGESVGKKEASAMALSELRTTTYQNMDLHKIVDISTPTVESGPIWTGLTEDAEVVFVYHVYCPKCGAEQLMTFENIRFHDCRDPRQMENKKLATYQCEHCDEHWTDADRDRAVAAGHWRDRESGLPLMAALQSKRPRTIGYHLPAWVSRFVSLSKCAAEFLRSLESRDALKNFLNSIKAEPWSELISKRLDTKAIAARREDYGPAVPMGAAVITCAIDVQRDRWEVETVAHGMDEESWRLDYQKIYGNPSLPTEWEKIDDYLKQTWRHETGHVMAIKCCCIDSGDNTKAVYNFTRGKLGRRIIATKGLSTLGKSLINGPTKQKLGPWRVPLLTIGTDTGKGTLFDYLEITEPGPGYMHFPAHFPDEFFEQYGTERQVEKVIKGRAVREWRKVKSDARNEAIDLGVLNLAALSFLSPNIPKLLDDLQRDPAEPADLDEEETPPQNQPVAKGRRPGRRRGGFVHNF